MATLKGRIVFRSINKEDWAEEVLAAGGFWDEAFPRMIILQEGGGDIHNARVGRETVIKCFQF